MGTISGFYNGLKTRESAVAERPSLYNITNWLTLGTTDTVKGAVTPEKPLSLEHWLDSLGVVSIAFGAYELAQKYAPAAVDDVAAFEKVVEDNTPPLSRYADTQTVSKGHLVVRDKKFFDENGHIDWAKYAPNDGFVEGTIRKETLPVGTLVDRYGDTGGTFVAPVGTPYEMRSLPYIENSAAYHVYRVIKPIPNVYSGEIAAAFGQLGGGTQYKLPNTIEWFLNEYLEEVTP